MLDVVSDVAGRQLSYRAAIGLEHHVDRIDMPDGSAGPVIDADMGVVVAADHALADRDRGSTVGALGAEFADVAAVPASELVESRAGVVVARDHHDLTGSVPGGRGDPFADGLLGDPVAADDIDPAAGRGPFDV